MHSALAIDSSQDAWKAHLSLGFVQTSARTVLKSRSHVGPLAVQRPFYPEGDVCHVYILHPPGGVVGGDELAIHINAATGSHALVTTPAAGKFYRSDGRTAKQSVNVKIAAGAIVEWLPQETIVFEDARLISRNQIDLEDGAKFMAWEVLAFGRPAAGEGFNAGLAQLHWRISRCGKTLLNEKLLIDAEAFIANWGLAGHCCCGSLMAYPAGKQALEVVRQLIGEQPARSVTLIDDLLICRGMDQRADNLSGFFKQVWQALREPLLQRKAVSPRIWAT